MVLGSDNIIDALRAYVEGAESPNVNERAVYSVNNRYCELTNIRKFCIKPDSKVF